MADVIVTSFKNLQNEVRYGQNHVLITDEPLAAGGDEAGPDPYTLVLAALGFGFDSSPYDTLLMAAIAILTLVSVSFYLVEWMRHMSTIDPK